MDICIIDSMGNSVLHKRNHSLFWSDDGDYGSNNIINRILDDLGNEVVKMFEVKLTLLILTLIGIPAYIYAWFLDINNEYDLVKSLILGGIGAFTGVVIGLRYFIKLLTEYKEFKRKYYPNRKREK